MRVQFEHKSVVSASTAAVWERATTPEGINYELMPIMRMTLPRALRGKTFADIELGKKLGRSWFLLFGFIPIDYDDIVLAEHEPGRRFRETSTMLSIRSWEHERAVRAVDGGCEVTDRISFEPRAPLRWIPGMGSVLRELLGFIFRHRHRRLAKYFGCGRAGASTQRVAQK